MQSASLFARRIMRNPLVGRPYFSRLPLSWIHHLIITIGAPKMGILNLQYLSFVIFIIRAAVHGGGRRRRRLSLS